MQQQQKENVQTKASPKNELLKSTQKPAKLANPSLLQLKRLEFRCKRIRFLGRKCLIVMQNSNGPCAIIAIANHLSLTQSEIFFKRYSKTPIVITYDEVINELVDYLKTKESPDEFLKDKLLKIKDGLCVDVGFDSCFSFENSDEIRLFKRFGVVLCHCWLPDPQNTMLHAAIKGSSSTKAFSLIFKESDDEEDDDGEEPPSVNTDMEAPKHRSMLIQEFLLHDFPQQVTYFGIRQLIENLQEFECVILYKNSHFYNLLKRDNMLFVLCTDEGFCSQKRIVWESFSSLTGDEAFFTSEFEAYPSDDEENAILRPSKSKKSCFNCCIS